MDFGLPFLCERVPPPYEQRLNAVTDAELAGCLFSQPPLQQGHGPKNQVLTLTPDFELESRNMRKQGLTISAVVALMAAASEFLIHHCHLRKTMMAENPVMH